MLTSAKSVIITPGYGLAVSRAQYTVAALTKFLSDNGIDKSSFKLKLIKALRKA